MTPRTSLLPGEEGEGVIRTYRLQEGQAKKHGALLLVRQTGTSPLPAKADGTATCPPLGREVGQHSRGTSLLPATSTREGGAACE